MNPDEKARRKQIKQDLRLDERSKFIASLPAKPSLITELFEYVDDKPCDNTLRHSVAFIRQQELPETTTVAWLNANGGFCDCEVIFNVENAWDELVTEEWKRPKYE